MQISSVYCCFPLAWTGGYIHTIPDGASCSASHRGGGERLYTGYGLSKVRTVRRALSQVYAKAQKQQHQQQQQQISNVNCELLKGRAIDNSPLLYDRLPLTHKPPYQ